MAQVKQFTNPDWTHTYVKNWKNWLSPFINQPINAVEVGSFEFRSGDWFMQNILTNPESKLICIDNWKPNWYAKMDDVEANWNFNSAEYGSRVRKVKEDSIVGISKLILENIEIAFAYIDGSHNAHDVARDGLMLWEILKSGGVLFFDDYNWTNPNTKVPPKQAIDFLLHVLEYARHEIVKNQVAIWKK